VVESGKFDWAASGKFPSLTEPEPAYHGCASTKLWGFRPHHQSPRRRFARLWTDDGAVTRFLTITGTETLHIRMERHCENAQKVPNSWRDTRGRLVSYAGLESSPYRAWRRNTCRKAPGRCSPSHQGWFEAGIKLVETVGLFSHLADIGDTRSLILHPASTTHRQLTDEQRLAAGAGPEVIRLSIGLETAADLIADLDQALAGA